jgi:hypothetical protein
MPGGRTFVTPAPGRDRSSRVPDWLHEIKHDGFSIAARSDAKGVRLYTGILGLTASLVLLAGMWLCMGRG